MNKANYLRLNVARMPSKAATFAATSTVERSRSPRTLKPIDTNRRGIVSLGEFLAEEDQAKRVRESDASRVNSPAHGDESANTFDANVYPAQYQNQLKYETCRQLKYETYRQDSVITNKVKALLIKEEGINSLDVGVKAHGGVVQLSGWITKPQQMTQIEKIVLSVAGVKNVFNGLRVKR